MLELAKTNLPRFSIIVPTYNTGSVLVQCLNSLNDQTADKRCFEVIVVNDGEKNEITETLDSLGHQLAIRYFHQEHKGPAGARNLGIKKAKGEVILFLDDDSCATSDWLDSIIKAWEKSPDFDGIGGFVLSTPMDNIYCRINSDLFNWYLKQNSYGEYCHFLCTCNASYRKEALHRVGSFDEQFQKAAGEDKDLNIKIIKTGGKLRLDESIFVYHDRDLKFCSFVRKYYSYGKAAFEISVRYPEVKRLPRKAYVHLFLPVFKNYRMFHEKISAFLLLTLSQFATLAGYFIAKLSKLKERP